MKLIIPSYVRKLMDRLRKNGYECYVVGGAIRSMLSGEPVNDYDLTTNALPEEMKNVFHDFHTIETGLKHGTLTVMSDHELVEITTYRKDGDYDDHRHPAEVTFTRAVREDCARRDFTVNALCYSDEEGLLDFFSGMEDLNNKIIRCIGEADARFDEDALRILRAIRFAARLSFTIEENTSEAIFKNRDLLQYISRERIHQELDGFFRAKECASFLEDYREVFEVFIPQLKLLDETTWAKTLDHISRSDHDPLVRMALLLSEVEDPAVVLNDLKYSNKDKNTILTMIRYKDHMINDKTDLRKFLSVCHVEYPLYSAFKHAYDASFASDELSLKYDEIIAKNEVYTLKQLAIKGNDLKSMGYQGKQIALILNDLLEQVIEGTLENTSGQLLAYIEKNF